MKKLNVLIAFDGNGEIPENIKSKEEIEFNEWSTEIYVLKTLKILGHKVRTIGVYDDINPLVVELNENRPDIVFNLIEAFLGEYAYDRNIPALFELMRVSYTGCSPAGLMVCNNKALSKKILNYHKISVPQFKVFKIKERVKLPARIKYPVFVKPLGEEASTGITRASLAQNEKDLIERTAYLRQQFNRSIIVEEYIDGRELYAGVLGHKKLWVFYPWEMKFTQVPEDEPKLATYKAKWDKAYRKRWGIKNEAADPIPQDVLDRIVKICKKAFRVLNLHGYARFDLRLTKDNKVYIIEANANPELSKPEDFAASANKAGINFEDLISKIINLGLNRS